MTIEEMNRRKEELGYSYHQIAKLSGIAEETVKKVLSGEETACRYDNLQALEKVLSPKADRLQEAANAYLVEKQQGEYTIEDYFNLPDDQRVELIDGVFYDMASPTHIHQVMGDYICRCFGDYINTNKGRCIAITSPIDVQLDCDDKTMVQPDVVIICDRDKFQKGRIFGAPDLIVEVLSKSTRRKDTTKKLVKYLEAGVREYWMVDPERKKVMVYDLEKEEHPIIYGLDEKVPVNIFEGKCEVDFAEIYERVAFLYDRL